MKGALVTTASVNEDVDEGGRLKENVNFVVGGAISVADEAVDGKLKPPGTEAGKLKRLLPEEAEETGPKIRGVVVISVVGALGIPNLMPVTAPVEAGVMQKEAVGADFIIDSLREFCC